jgi:threonine/homoserine/homoserine lactone efflux protein
MGDLVPKVILIGLGAAVSPVAIMILLAIMVKKDARRNSLLFLAGFVLVLVAVGVAGLFLFDKAGSGHHGALDGWIDVALGVACAVLIPYACKKKPKPEKAEAEHGMKPWRAFVVGMAAMFVNASTFVLFVSGVHAITQAKVSTSDGAIAFVILTFATLLTLLIPIAIYLISPERSEKFMTALGGWLARHRKVIAIGILLVFAVYLLAKGISTLV